MADAIKEIINSLERQRRAIENALAALRGIQEGGQSAGTASSSPGRTAVKRKGGMTPEGRRRLAEAMKRRWAVKRAASQVKKTARKRAPAKKAAA
ncbi:MAG TPA: hypothetical protein VG345_10195 [Bryobacteraceae bacterium]|jgi:hypothetical protein|nr:hypothetical protein [Bryobacteraceae bacterium]